jgi:hypothetical protein
MYISIGTIKERGTITLTSGAAQGLSGKNPLPERSSGTKTDARLRFHYRTRSGSRAPDFPHSVPDPARVIRAHLHDEGVLKKPVLHLALCVIAGDSTLTRHGAF